VPKNDFTVAVASICHLALFFSCIMVRTSYFLVRCRWCLTRPTCWFEFLQC